MKLKMQLSIFNKPQVHDVVPAVDATGQQQRRYLPLDLHTWINLHTVDVGRVEVLREAAGHMRRLNHVDNEEGLVLAMHEELRLDCRPLEARLLATFKSKRPGSLKPLAALLRTVALVLW